MQQNGNLVTGVPEDLVLNGSFESAFAKSGFFFDKSSGTFNIYQDICTHAIHITGDSTLIFWTKRALQREGYGISESADALYKVTCETGNNVPQWQLEYQNRTTKFASISALVTGIKFINLR